MSEQKVDPKVKAAWIKLATPEVLVANLIGASLFLVAWEMLKGSILNKPLVFFATDFRDGEWQPSPEYRTVVLALHKSPLTASFLWFKDMGAFTEDDLEKFHKAREYRNAIAHNLPEFLGSFDRDLEDQQLLAVQELLVKVDKWWIKEVEIPTNPDFDGQDIAEDEISSGNMLLLRMIFDVVSGRQEYLEFLEKMPVRED